MNRDEFFAMLDQLSPIEIEARLPSWDDEELKLVQEYLERKGRHAEEARRGARNVADAKLVAAEMAARAHKMATVALIIAIGAMLAAIAAGVVALSALQR
jgi:hypothetical protein